MELIPTIGLEIHAQLKTATKMFCACLNNPDEKRPNVNICPVCTGQPGTLPAANQAAIRNVLRVGVALGGTLADFSEFDRKNYFYPDIPKGYQISQYQYPLVQGGNLGGLALTRIHLEEDTARSQHDTDPHYSLVDFNRSGVPLMELVTEPVITSGKQAADFGRELQLLLRYLDVSEANMEKGEMRVEANISVAPAGQRGTKVEIKNLNSFRTVELATAYEIKRQSELLAAGEKVVQETRGWDEAAQETYSQRQKESAHDYRYFPDPDLPKMKLSEVAEFSVENLKKTLPELPWEKRERYKGFGIQAQDIELYVSDIKLGTYFEAVIKDLPAGLIKIASNFLSNDVVGLIKKNPALPLPSSDKLVNIIKDFGDKKINSRQAKDDIKDLVEHNKINIRVHDMLKISEGDLVQKIIAANPQSVADYKAGKEAALQFLVGQGMKESKGSANPGVLAKLIKESLI